MLLLLLLFAPGEVAPSQPGAQSAAAGVVGGVVDSLPAGAGAGAAAVAAHSLGLSGTAGSYFAGSSSHAAAAAAGQPPAPQSPEPMQADGAGLQEQQKQPQRPAKNEAIDFVLAVGDDRSDEDMFIAIEQYADTPRHPAEVSRRISSLRPVTALSTATPIQQSSNGNLAALAAPLVSRQGEGATGRRASRKQLRYCTVT